MASYAQSSAPAVSASAPKAEQRKPGALISINIEVAQNGFVGSCRHEPPKAKKGEFPSYQEPAQYVLSDVEAVKKFIDEKLGAGKK